MSASSKIFPITLSCSPLGWSSYAFKPYFMEAKPADLIWYAYDTIIHSQTSVEFVVYDMADNVYGGLGKNIASFKATVPEHATTAAIDQKIAILARARRDAELLASEVAIVNDYAAEIRKSLTASPSETP